MGAERHSTILTPDVGFVKGLIGSGADNLKRCYQCATCSVVCDLTPQDNPFPRKEMIMAQWGLKEALAKDPDIWLCHNCNDCTKFCPRGARPGDVIAALRKSAIAENAFPKFMGKLIGSPALTIIALAIPVVLFLIILSTGDHLQIPDGPVVFDHFFPIHYVDPIFIAVAMLVLASFVISVRKFWNGLNAEPYKLLAYGQFLPSFIETLKEIFAHGKFGKCGANKDRTTAHRLVLFGFIGLFITTNWAVFYMYVLKWASPYAIEEGSKIFGDSQAMAAMAYGAFKIFGNISALLLLIGGIMVISNRMKDRGFVSKTSSFDWTFALIILLLAITGILSEMLRLSNMATLAYPMYFAHLVFVFYIIAYLPFSKLAHMVYRTTAITYSKMAKRDIM